MKLTPATARELPPGGRLCDHEVRGLELRAGKRRKTWLMYYRAPDGQQRRPALGTYPELSLSAARDAAKALLLSVAKGQDPSASRQHSRVEPSMKALCTWYEETWAPTRKKGRSLAEDKHMIAAYVLPTLGALRLSAVTSTRVQTLLDDVLHRRLISKEVKARDGKATAPGRAASVRQLLRHMLGRAARRFLEQHGRTYPETWPNGNPVEDTHAPNLHARRRRASPAELAAVRAELDKLELTAPRTVAGIWVLFLIGARVGEVLNATEDMLRGASFVLRDHKTAKHIGDKVIPVPLPVFAILERIGTDAAGRWFPSYKTVIRAWWRVREAAGCPDLQLRDARRTFSSQALGEGKTLDQLADLYGHTSTQTTKGYSWLLEDEKRAVAEAGAAAIEKAARG